MVEGLGKPSKGWGTRPASISILAVEAVEVAVRPSCKGLTEKTVVGV